MRNNFLRGVLTACLFAAGFAPAVTAATQSDVISEGVYIGDQNVGGMTAEEAEAYVKSKVEELASSVITIPPF